MLNQIILIGRLTKDPERRGQNSEKPVAVIRLAVDRDFKRDGDPDADFFNCSVFGNQAKFVLEYGKKGRLVSLVGRMQQREWTDQQTGEKHTVYEVSGSDIKFLDITILILQMIFSIWQTLALQSFQWSLLFARRKTRMRLHTMIYLFFLSSTRYLQRKCLSVKKRADRLLSITI